MHAYVSFQQRYGKREYFDCQSLSNIEMMLILYSCLNIFCTDHCSINAFLLFTICKYFFQQFSTLTMEGMGYINYDSMKAGARYDVVCELRFNQKEPLPHKGTDYRYNVRIILM